MFLNGGIDASGEGSLSLVIPNNPALAGGLFTFQTALLPASGLPILLSNATSAVLNP